VTQLRQKMLEELQTHHAPRRRTLPRISLPLARMIAPGSDVARLAPSSEPKYQASTETNVVLRLHGNSRTHKFRSKVIDVEANCERPGNVVFDPGSYRPREARQPSPVIQLIHWNGAIYQAHAGKGANEQSSIIVLRRNKHRTCEKTKDVATVAGAGIPAGANIAGIQGRSPALSEVDRCAGINAAQFDRWLS